MKTRREVIGASLALTATGLLPAFANASSSSGVHTATENQRIVLASRPVGKPTLSNFRLESSPIVAPEKGELLLRTRYLSLDPYMRGRMNAAKGYAANVAVGDAMIGGTISEVVESHHPDYAAGDKIVSNSGWQSYETSNGQGIRKLDPRITRESYGLGVLGMPGLTAYVGLLDLGQPKAGDTVVLAASTGAVGSVVGQIAKLKGCRVVGIAGAKAKCDYAVKELGYDACISHYDDTMAEQLAAACPNGIDVYFENVGGSSWEAVMPLLNNHARVPVCGLIAHYNQTELPPGPDRMSMLQSMILTKRIKMQGFIISDYAHRIPDFVGDVSQWMSEGKIKYKEDVVQGLENAPEAFLGLFSGNNFGKLVVRL